MFSVAMERIAFEKNQDAYILKECALLVKNHSPIMQKPKNARFRAV